MLKPEGEESHSGDNIMVRIAQKLFRTTDHYDGDKLITVENGKKVLTPMVLVIAAIGGTDILFALDSIPAIYGLTENVYIVFTATAFSLLGLRQLFFLIDGLLDRLIYLSYGLAAILGFIGIKLICTHCTRTTCRLSMAANRSMWLRSAPRSPSVSSSASCSSQWSPP
jgi:tellurite resistance protein TerC